MWDRPRDTYILDRVIACGRRLLVGASRYTFAIHSHTDMGMKIEYEIFLRDNPGSGWTFREWLGHQRSLVQKRLDDLERHDQMLLDEEE